MGKYSNMGEFDIYNLLIGTEVFADLTFKEFKVLKNYLKEFHFKEGEYILTEGEQSKELYLLGEGSLEVQKKGDGQDFFTIGKIEQGKIFGELAFIDNEPRSSSIMATTPTTVFRLNMEDLEDKDGIGAAIYQRIYQKIVQQCFNYIRNTNTDYVDNLKAEIQDLDIANNFGSFFVYFITFFGIYNLFMHYLPIGSAVEHPVIMLFLSLIFLVPTLLYLKSRQLDLPKIGITTQNLGVTLGETAILLTYAILTLSTLFYLFTGNIVEFYDQLGRHLERFLQGKSIALLGYVFVLEVMIRGIIQSSLKNFLRDSSGHSTILLIAAFFLPLHISMGLAMAFIRFSLDIIFGEVYNHQKNIFGVVVLHFFLMVVVSHGF